MTSTDVYQVAVGNLKISDQEICTEKQKSSQKYHHSNAMPSPSRCTDRATYIPQSGKLVLHNFIEG